MAKRVIDNSFGGGSQGTVAYAPVRGWSHAKQDPVALLTAYMGAYEDAMRFAKNRCAANGGRIPEVSKAEDKSEDWYAGMIANAANAEESYNRRGDHEGGARCHDAICALYSEAVALGAAKPLVNDGEKYRKGNSNRARKLNMQNRATAAEAEQRKKDIRAAADTKFPDRGKVTRKEVIDQLYEMSGKDGAGWSKPMIKRAIGGMFGQRAKA